MPSNPLRAHEGVRVAWLLSATNYEQASVRYRCCHPAANLAGRGLAQAVYTDARRLIERLGEHDVVIVVKRLDPEIVTVAAICSERGKPVFLDLCDDIVTEDGRPSPRAVPGAVLRAVAPLLSAVLCPTPAMQNRVRDHLRDSGLLDVEVRVVPDCIETDEVYQLSKAVWKRIRGAPAVDREMEAGPSDAALEAGGARTRLCWFGNWGGPHSDFGLMSLLPVVGRLSAYAHRHEVVLHLVSNHRELGELLQQRARFQVVYHEWSREQLSAVLAQSHFTLVTSGDDQFSVIKSPNRTLLSLASGVPVIVENGAEAAGSLWTERGDMPLTERIVEILDDAREHGHDVVRDRMLSVVQPALARYRIERIGTQYQELFGRHLRPPAPLSLDRPTRIAHIFAADEDLELALRVRQACLAQGIEFMAITALGEMKRRKSLFGFFADHGIKPSVVVDGDAGATDARRLRGAQLVIQASSAGRDFGALVRGWCEQRGVPTMSQGAFLYHFRHGG